jgi:DNA-binding CsgD family transcriptional regulator
VAHHWAAAGDAPRAFAAALAAAGAAERVHAPGEAAGLLERALELWDRVEDPGGRAGGDRVALLHRTARAHLGARDFHRAHRLLREALAGVDPAAEPRRAAALLERLGRARWELGQGEGAVAAYDEGLALLDADRPTPERAALLAGQARVLMLITRGREAVATGREAIAVARTVGDRAVESHALTTVGTARMWRGEVDEGIADLRTAVELARADGRWDDVARGQANLVDALHAAGRSRAAVTLARDAAAELERAGWPVPWLALVLSEVRFALGDWAGADAAADPERHTSLSGVGRLFFDLRRAELALGRGDVDAALASIERARERAAGSLEPQWHGSLAALCAEAHRRAGRLDEARAAIDDGLGRLSGDDTQDGLWVARIAAAGASVEADAALLHRATAHPAEVAAAVARAEALVDRARAALLCERADAQPELAAQVATAAAELDRARDARADWLAAAAAWDALERPYPAAVARWRAAEQGAAAGEREEAAALAARAREVAERLGAAWLVAELDGLIRRARLAGGARPAGDEDGDEAPFGLTPREQEVLALLAEGRTNREIGVTLFMAEKTASVHVSRILAKLDVRSRTEAAAVGHRLLAARA